MALSSSLSCMVLLLISCNSANAIGVSNIGANSGRNRLSGDEKDQFKFAMNLEFLEAVYFLNSALGRGLDGVAPELAMGGPPPVGAQRAALSDLTNDIITQFAYQEVGHLRTITSILMGGGIARPLIDLSALNIGKMMNDAFGYELEPPFNPYVNDINFILGCYLLPYVGLVGYVGTNPNLNSRVSKKLLAGLLAVEAGQDAVIRILLYQRKDELVDPYNMTIAEFTNRISELRNRLAGTGVKDEGLTVPENLGAENETTNNIISADVNSLGYPRTPVEILRILYGTGDETIPGGFLPHGANGAIARSFLRAPR